MRGLRRPRGVREYAGEKVRVTGSALARGTWRSWSPSTEIDWVNSLFRPAGSQHAPIDPRFSKKTMRPWNGRACTVLGSDRQVVDLSVVIRMALPDTLSRGIRQATAATAECRLPVGFRIGLGDAQLHSVRRFRSSPSVAFERGPAPFRCGPWKVHALERSSKDGDISFSDRDVLDPQRMASASAHGQRQAGISRRARAARGRRSEHGRAADPGQ